MNSPINAPCVFLLFRSRRMLLCTVLAACGFIGTTTDAAETPRPNILFILIDDLRWDDMGCAGHPFVKTPHIDRLAREGALFRNAFATTPLCSPSRASFLTGQYAHTHGVRDNTNNAPLSQRLITFPRLLHDAGYETAFIGKWHMGTDDSPRPGFDHWVSFKGQGTYHNPTLNVDGKELRVNGYMTDILNARAVEFLKQPRTKPFLLYFAHKAVHPELTQNADGSISDPTAGVFIPAERHKDLYAGQPVPHRANTHDTLVGKPALQRKIGDLPPLGPETGTSDETVRNRLRILAAVDEGVGEILRTLEQHRALDNTLVVFTSDHGYFYGEHGLSVERRLAYEEAIRIPLLMRYPPLIKAGSTPEEIVLNIDLAPTLLELGGKSVPKEMQGRSFASLLSGRAYEPRKSFLIEYFTDTVFPRMLNMGYQAVRTDRWKYIRYTELTSMDELYDLHADPYELRNLVAEPSASDVVSTLRAEAKRLLKANN